MSKEYDYIIVGGGCAGLSLAYRMSMDSFFDSKTILLIEPNDKDQNDRTWSYWSDEEKFYNNWAIKNWEKLSFKSLLKETPLEIAPYKYFTIRGIDFYNSTLPQIKKSSNITILKKSVTDLSFLENGVEISLMDGSKAKGKFCFDSRISKSIDFKKSNFVWQHFKGWVVSSPDDYFDDSQALFMDFGIDQEQDTRFFYILPFSKRKALIQIAIFSNEIVSSSDYDVLIKDYIQLTHPTLDYTIEEEEYDKIPMTDYAFPVSAGKNHMYIGTASGMVKASSGFAFKRIQDQSEGIIDLLKKQMNPINATKAIARKKYSILDGTFMNVILTNRLSGKEVFTKLLERNNGKTVFDFLAQKATIFQELKIMSSLPTLPFLKSFIKTIRNQ